MNDVRQGDVYPFIVVGTEVYDDNGNLERGLLFHIEYSGVRAGARASAAEIQVSAELAAELVAARPELLCVPASVWE